MKSSNLGLTVRERTLLEDLKRRLFEAVGVKSEAAVAQAFAAFDTNSDTTLSIHEFVDGISGLGVRIFDSNGDLTISPVEFFDGLKKVD
jgi:hypothetical protein